MLTLRKFEPTTADRRQAAEPGGGQVRPGRGHSGAPQRAAFKPFATLQRTISAFAQQSALRSTLTASATLVQADLTPVHHERVRLALRQSQHRLSPGEIAAAVAAYKAGCSVAGLSREFKLHKATVHAHRVRGRCGSASSAGPDTRAGWRSHPALSERCHPQTARTEVRSQSNNRP